MTNSTPVMKVSRPQLQDMLVSAVRVVKAYEATLETVMDETERHWLEEGLQNSIARAEAYKRALDRPK